MTHIGASTSYAELAEVLRTIKAHQLMTSDQWKALQETIARCEDAIAEGRDED